MTFTKKLLALACTGLFAVGSAHSAASLSQAISPGFNLLSDDNAELVLKYDATSPGNYRAFAAGETIDVNDIFVGIVKMTSFPTGSLGTDSTLYNEVTAIYAVQALTKFTYSSVPTIPDPGASCGATVLTTCSSYTFGAASLASATDPLNAVVTLLNANYGTTLGAVANTGAKSFATVFEDTSPDFNRATGGVNYNAAFASAADGTQRFVFDLIGSTNYFNATGPADPLQLGLLIDTANGGSIGAVGTVSYQNVPNWVFGPNISITGNLARAQDGPFGIWTDSTYGLNATRVPEPATLALVGLALAGIGFSRAGRRNRAV